MLSSQRRIFADRNRLHQEPFCPYYTNESGQQSLKRNSIDLDHQTGVAPHVRHSHHDGKRLN